MANILSCRMSLINKTNLTPILKVYILERFQLKYSFGKKTQNKFKYLWFYITIYRVNQKSWNDQISSELLVGSKNKK